MAFSKTEKTEGINSVDFKKIQIKVYGCNITGLRKIMKLLTHNMFLRRTEIPSDSMRNVSKASNSDLWHRNVWVV